MNIIEKIKIFAKSMKRKIRVLFVASKRNDIGIFAKLIVIIVLGYALSPIDLIPDFIPVLGYLDDLILLPIGIAIAIKLIPKYILEECEAIVIKDENSIIPKSKTAALVIILIWVIVILIIYGIINEAIC